EGGGEKRRNPETSFVDYRRNWRLPALAPQSRDRFLRLRALVQRSLLLVCWPPETSPVGRRPCSRPFGPQFYTTWLHLSLPTSPHPCPLKPAGLLTQRTQTLLRRRCGAPAA